MEFDTISTILIIIGIDIVLGGDNAIVIALASRNLPEDKRNKAIFLGTGLAILIRVCLTSIAVILLRIPYLQLLGGIFLIAIAINLLREDDDGPSNIQGSISIFSAIKTIVVADIVMGFDNVIAIAGAAQGHLGLVLFGLLISVPIIIWGSKIILVFMERFPIIVYVGSGILAYTAGKMIVDEQKLSFIIDHYKFSTMLIPLFTILIVITSGWVKNRANNVANL